MKTVGEISFQILFLKKFHTCLELLKNHLLRDNNFLKVLAILIII